MSILDNIIKRSGDSEESGGVFNPFRVLEIGELMIRYTDGIRIKDFVFLAILTSERLILIDSAKQGAGVIAKEIPIPLIKEADIERDEKNRPTLALTMEVGGQYRVMRFIFTGLITEPETECREWYTAINGHPPVDSEVPKSSETLISETLNEEATKSEIREENRTTVALPQKQKGEVRSPIIDAESIQEHTEPEETPVTVKAEEPVVTTKKPQAIPQPVQQSEQPPIQPAVQPPVEQTVPLTTTTQTESQAVPETVPKVIPQKIADVSIPVKSEEKTAPPDYSKAKQQKMKKNEELHGRTEEGSICIVLEKPAIHPIYVTTYSKNKAYSNKSKHCIHCGILIPSVGKFCPVCGKEQY